MIKQVTIRGFEDEWVDDCVRRHFPDDASVTIIDVEYQTDGSPVILVEVDET